MAPAIPPQWFSPNYSKVAAPTSFLETRTTNTSHHPMPHGTAFPRTTYINASYSDFAEVLAATSTRQMVAITPQITPLPTITLNQCPSQSNSAGASRRPVFWTPGRIAGLSVGCGVVALIVTASIWALWKRKRCQQANNLQTTAGRSRVAPKDAPDSPVLQHPPVVWTSTDEDDRKSGQDAQTIPESARRRSSIISGFSERIRTIRDMEARIRYRHTRRYDDTNRTTGLGKSFGFPNPFETLKSAFKPFIGGHPQKSPNGIQTTTEAPVASPRPSLTRRYSSRSISAIKSLGSPGTLEPPTFLPVEDTIDGASEYDFPAPPRIPLSSIPEFPSPKSSTLSVLESPGGAHHRLSSSIRGLTGTPVPSNDDTSVYSRIIEGEKGFDALNSSHGHPSRPIFTESGSPRAPEEFQAESDNVRVDRGTRYLGTGLDIEAGVDRGGPVARDSGTNLGIEDEDAEQASPHCPLALIMGVPERAGSESPSRTNNLYMNLAGRGKEKSPVTECAD